MGGMTDAYNSNSLRRIYVSKINAHGIVLVSS